ncbi:hypothetical protein D3C80_668990 [compost metagenome]
MALVIFKQPLAAAAVVLDHLALLVCLAPEGVGKAAGGAGDLYRLCAGVGSGLSHFGGKQVEVVAGVVEHQAIGLARRQAQAAPHNLLIERHRLGGAQHHDEIHMGGIEAGGEHRHVDQKLDLPLLEGMDQGIALRPRGFAGDEGRRLGFGEQQPLNFPGVLDGGGEDHHPLPLGGIFQHLTQDMGGDPLLALELAVEIRLAEQAVLPGYQLAEVVVDYGGIYHARWRQVAVFDHEAQGQLEHAVAKEPLAVALHHAVVVAPVDPAQPHPVRGGGEPQDLEGRIGPLEMLDHLMVLAVVIERDSVALVDDEQGERPIKRGQVAGHRLHRAEHHLGVRLLAGQSGGEDVGLESPGLVLGVVLLHQLLDVGQHQHPATGLAGQLGDHQTLARPCGQHHHGGIRVLAKVADHGVDGVGLIGSENEHEGWCLDMVRRRMAPL